MARLSLNVRNRKVVSRDQVRQRAPAVTPGRVAALDALRGLALLAMIVYHFCFDLRYFGLTRSDFEHDPFWLVARALILSSFLFAAGVSLVLLLRADPTGRKFWRHVAAIAGCALLVSMASYAMFPRTYIWFGVLHAIALALVLARPLVAYPLVALGAGVVVIAAGLAFAHPVFDGRAFGWLGFMTAKPPTEDYVPLFPWMGVLLFGVAGANMLARASRSGALRLTHAPRPLLWLGRHTLPIYLVHQPVLIGLLWLALRLRAAN